MYFHLCGSSGAGKTAIGPGLVQRVSGLVFHDSDEHLDEPLSFWIDRALDYESEGLDMILASQRPFGELLATPNAVELAAIAGCLMDCDDFVRAERLRARGSPAFRDRGMDVLCWAVFHRMHAADPQWEQRVLLEQADDGQWHRWTHWEHGDPRWATTRIDTTTATIAEAAEAVAQWVESARLEPQLVRTKRWWESEPG